MCRGISETHGGENQTAGYTHQTSGRDSPMYRGSSEVFDGETQTSRDSGATSADTGPISVGYCQRCRVSVKTHKGETFLLDTQIKLLGRRPNAQGLN